VGQRAGVVEQNWMVSFSDFARGDWLGIIGIVVSMLGFIVSLYQIKKTTTAAQSALLASRDVQEKIKVSNSIVNLASLTRILNEIKSSIKSNDTSRLLYLVDDARNLLILAQKNATYLTDEEKSKVQKYLALLKNMELDLLESEKVSSEKKRKGYVRFLIESSDDIALMLTKDH
jgi:hypothetical protein